MHGMEGFWGGGFMMVVWWGLIILGVIALGKVLLGKNTPSNTQSSPLEILKRRYAKGEISKDEYENLKKDIL